MPLEDTSTAVFKAATVTGKLNGSGGNGVFGHHPYEEHGGEERPEQHRLRDDEQQHAEHLRVNAGAVVRRGRAVMLLVWEAVRVGDAGRFHSGFS